MQAAGSPKRYEDHAHVLDYDPHGRSSNFRGREGVIVSAVGEDRLALLEILGAEGSRFEVGERLCLGRENRTKAASVLGRVDYGRLSFSAQNELAGVVEGIVRLREERFIAYVNAAEPLTPRTHSLELIPGIGKKLMRTIVEERGRERFASYADLQERTGLHDPARCVAERIVDELAGRERVRLFARR